MLHKDFSPMDNDVWDCCPADTNAVERKKQDSKDKIPQQLQSTMINLYKADKYKCTKHMVAMDGTSITYSDKNCEGRKKAAVSRSSERRSLRVILMLCMAPLIVKLTLRSQQPQRGT